MSLFGHLKMFSLIFCNPCQSSPSLTILVPLWFIIIICLMFFYFSKLLFPRNFVLGQSSSKYPAIEHLLTAPVSHTFVFCFNMREFGSDIYSEHVEKEVRDVGSTWSQVQRWASDRQHFSSLVTPCVLHRVRRGLSK